MKALYIVCTNQKYDIVGHNVSEYLLNNYELKQLDYDNELCKVYMTKKDNHEYYFMFTPDLVMWDTKKYLNILNKYFSDVEAAIHINYHAGANAPDPVLTVHHVGDIISNTYLPYNPKYATNLIVNMKKLKDKYELDEFTIESETTHFTGVVRDVPVKDLAAYPINTIDLEIGSVVESFNNEKAIKIISETTFEIFNDTQDKRINVLYLGGAHFETTYTNAIFNEKYPIYLAHQLCGLWLMQVEAEQVKENISNLIDKSSIKYDAIVFHEKVKKLKPILEEIANEKNIKLFKYNALKNIETSDMHLLFD